MNYNNHKNRLFELKGDQDASHLRQQFNILNNSSKKLPFFTVLGKLFLDVPHEHYFIERNVGAGPNVYKITLGENSSEGIEISFNTEYGASLFFTDANSIASLEVKARALLSNLKYLTKNNYVLRYEDNNASETANELLNSFNERALNLLKFYHETTPEKLEIQKAENGFGISIVGLSQDSFLTQVGLAKNSVFANYALLENVEKESLYWALDIGSRDLLDNNSYKELKKYISIDKKRYYDNALANSHPLHTLGHLIDSLKVNLETVVFAGPQLFGTDLRILKVNFATVKSALSKTIERINNGENKQTFSSHSDWIQSYVDLKSAAHKASLKFVKEKNILSSSTSGDYEELSLLLANYRWLVTAVLKANTKKENRAAWETWTKIIASEKKDKFSLRNPNAKLGSSAFVSIVSSLSFGLFKHKSPPTKVDELLATPLNAPIDNIATNQIAATPVEAPLLINQIDITPIKAKLAAHSAALQANTQTVSLLSIREDVDSLMDSTNEKTKLVIKNAESLLTLCITNEIMNSDIRLFLTSHLDGFIKSYNQSFDFMQKNDKFGSSSPEVKEAIHNIYESFDKQSNLTQERITHLKQEVVAIMTQPILKDSAINQVFLEQKISQLRQSSMPLNNNIETADILIAPKELRHKAS